jgi:hypothetical protein
MVSFMNCRNSPWKGGWMGTRADQLNGPSYYNSVLTCVEEIKCETQNFEEGRKGYVGRMGFSYGGQRVRSV